MLTLKNFNKTSKTFTISRTEQSNMSSGWTYSDDATGLTAGDGAFDDFFGYSAVLLNTSGVETSEITQTGGVFSDTISNLGNITSGDNVMIKFPIRGIKMSKSGSVVTLSITSELGKSGYQYYAFQTGSINNITDTKSKFYFSVYRCYDNGTALKSWSGVIPTNTLSVADKYSKSKNNNSSLLWNIPSYYHYSYIKALYMMKYGNPDCQTVVGTGCLTSTLANGGTNNQLNATYGTSSSDAQVRLFGIESPRGINGEQYEGELVGGCYTHPNYYRLCVKLSGYDENKSGGYDLDSYGSSLSGEISSVFGNNNSMFLTKAATSNSSYNTYYCDYVYMGNINAYIQTDGGSGSNNGYGLFNMSCFAGNVSRLVYY